MSTPQKTTQHTQRITPVKLIFISLFVSLVSFGIGMTLHSCTDGKSLEDNLKKFEITDINIPSSVDVFAEGEITLTGKGFEPEDQIRLLALNDTTVAYLINAASVTEQSITFTTPTGFTSGTYKVFAIRSDQCLLLGEMSINIIVNTEIPDIEGMTVKGVVYCEGTAIPGVVVSDGFEVTTTDEHGVYYLPSQKKHGYVFISMPGNYEVARSNVNATLFYQTLEGSSAVEQKNFELVRVDNENHVVIMIADVHLANRNDDLLQFSTRFLTDINSTINSYRSENKKVYGLTLGDMSWDNYWYSNNFDLSNSLTYMSQINCPVFNMIGNHDHDPYYANDWMSENKFRELLGPTYYSFNLGQVHYVVLDDTEYINTGGSPGVLGQRNYNARIVNDQMQWLQKDLSTIQDKNTPIVVAMHIQLYSNSSLNNQGQPMINISLDNGSSLVSALQDFSNVHVITGHTHTNYNIEASDRLMEHNTAAVCATWWWTGKSGYAGNHICKDGTPGGYGVWDINNRDIAWYYKSLGYEKDYQFRTYDLNTVYITAAQYAPKSSDAALAQYAGIYATRNTNNEVLINVWNYDSRWEIEVKEGDKILDITCVVTKDPLHIISYEAKRLNVAAIPTSDFVSNNITHMFKVKASNATSTLNIRVTDRFGNVYTETMERPKVFNYQMR